MTCISWETFLLEMFKMTSKMKQIICPICITINTNSDTNPPSSEIKNK